jgi:hypothetical protein
MGESKAYTIELSASLYPVEAALKAAALSFRVDGWVYFLRKEGQDKYALVLTQDLHKSPAQASLDDSIHDFWEELQRQTIRFLVAQRTSTLRNLIVGRALYHTCLHVQSPGVDRNVVPNDT